MTSYMHGTGRPINKLKMRLEIWMKILELIFYQECQSFVTWFNHKVALTHDFFLKPG